MAGNTFGHRFRVTTFGESHGVALGGVVDGVPAGLALSEADLQPQLDRRRPGQSRLVTPRREADRVRLLAGVFDGRTTGAPVAFTFENGDVDSSKYEDLRELYRPSHADFTYEARYGHRDWRGGGRSSARETVARVAAGAIAERVLASLCPGASVVCWVSAVGDVEAAGIDPLSVAREAVDRNDVRCPEPESAERMEELIRSVRREKDSIGGMVSGVIRGLPAGLGAPVFDRFEAELARGMMSLPAAKGFEVGSGFAGTRMRGSAHNDPFWHDGDRVRTRTNHSGGVQGGITTGEPVTFRVAFKPVATIFRSQETVNRSGESVTFAARGRHDPCVLPRAVPIVEAMAALVAVDAVLGGLGVRVPAAD
ncbi:MAG: chorismate synthase [Deltaproteobacteria bacterium]|nr:MAG: chorismate synthase [Deltaproteobacteria bacterium]